MNDVVMKGLLKMVKNFVSPEQIKEAARGLIQMAINYRNTLYLNEGETEIAYMQWERAGVVYTAIVYINEDNKILRIENIQPIDQIIDNLINKI